MAEKKKGNQKTANSLNVRYKYSENLSEKQAIYNNLCNRPKTRWEVSKETGIEINSVCYIVGMLRNENKCKVHHIGICPIKGSTGVEFITTNHDLFQTGEQFKFDF